MPIFTARGLVCSAALFAALGPGRSLQAQIGIGTWVRTAATTSPPTSPTKMTMTVEACCGSGRKLTYHFDVNGTDMVMTVESRFDGSEAPMLVNGKPTGGTMAIKRTDDRHTSTIVKQNGKPFGTSEATLSADGKTLTVVNDYATPVGSQTAGKSTEIWTRK